jgi:hypothetical protein
MKNSTALREARWLALGLFVSLGCVTARAPRSELPKRVPGSVPERVEGTAEASGVGNDEGAEERFGFKEDQARRDAAKAKKARDKSRLGVVDKSGKPPQ